MPNLAEVLRQHWPEYLRLHQGTLSADQRAAVGAILRCHSPECGGGVYHCAHCHKSHFMPHGCGHRACPQCGHHHTQRWIENQTRRLLPVNYFMVTFTVPEAVRAVFKAHPKEMSEVLFAQSAGALADVAASPKHLGGALGMIGVLHTWSRLLVYHPHVHYVVPGVALTPEGALRSPDKPDYLLPVHVLKARYRSRMREALSQQHPQILAQLPSKVWAKGWNLNVIAVGQGKGALQYLARYVFKTAISSTRILKDQNHRVSFSYKDSSTRELKVCTVDAMEFIRRFLQHVLPKGLHRVRTFGWLSPAAKKRFQRICAILDVLAACQPAPSRPPVEMPCPDCRRPMRLIRTLPRGPPLA
jgi:hypothetical protein